jgi:hypothetical protein
MYHHPLQYLNFCQINIFFLTSKSVFKYLFAIGVLPETQSRALSSFPLLILSAIPIQLLSDPSNTNFPFGLK